MNYRQQLIHEAVMELRQEQPELLAHVTDITCDWEDKSRSVVYYLVHKGAGYIIRNYDHRYGSRLALWGLKEKVTDPSQRAIWVGNIRPLIISTIKHAEKTSANRRRLDHLYPGLAQ